MMKRLSLLILSILLSACAASVVEERDAPPPTLDIQPPMVVEPGTTDEEPAIESPRSLFITTEQVPRVFVQNLATHRRPDFVTFITEEEMKTYQEVFFIYQFRSDLQSMFPTVVLPDVATYHYEVKEVGSQRHIYLNPGDFVRQMDLFGDLKQIDVTEEGIFELPFSFPSLDRSRSIESFGSIAVVTTALNDGEKVGFLPADRHVVFQDSDEALAQDFDTYIFMYEQNNDPNYPRNNFGQVLNPGEILGLKREGKTFILLRFSSHLRPELSQLRSNVLSLNGRVRIEEYLELSVGKVFSSGGFLPAPNPSTIPLTSLNLFNEIGVCRIQQTNTGRNPNNLLPYSDVRAFPHYTRIPFRGKVNIAIVAVEFPDVRGETDLLPIYQNQMGLIEEWSRFVSNGKMEYVVHFPNQWIMAPNDARFYTDPNSRNDPNSQNQNATAGELFQTTDESITQIIRAADDLIDWSIIDFAQFIFPYESEQFGTFLYSHGGNYSTPRAGSVSFPVYAETVLNFHPNSPNPRSRTHWDWIVHEILHFQGIIGHGPVNGGPYGIMMDQHAPSKALLSWESFLLGYFDQNDFVCVPEHQISVPLAFRLESLDLLGGSPGMKSLMVPLSNHEIVVVEYRTEGPFSNLPEELRGFTAYYIDGRKPWIRCDQCDQTALEIENFWRYLRSETNIFQCSNDYFNPSFCGQKSITQKPGDTLIFRNLRFDFFDNQVIEVRRLA
jgi:hypothetical protein